MKSTVAFEDDTVLNLFWEDTEGNILTACKGGNTASLVIDKYAITFKNADGVTVDQVHKILSKVVYYFFLHVVRLNSIMNGHRQHSKGLGQGRHELQSRFRFSIYNENIMKM